MWADTCLNTNTRTHTPFPLCKGCGVRDPLGGQTEDDFYTIWCSGRKPLRKEIRSLCHIYLTTWKIRVLYSLSFKSQRIRRHRVTSWVMSALSDLHTECKPKPMMMPQWFILMAKLLIYQITFQSGSSCAKTGPRKENPFVLGQNNLTFKTRLYSQEPRITKKEKETKAWPVTEAIPQRATSLRNSKCLFSHPPLVHHQRFASMSDLRYGEINRRLTRAPWEPSSLWGGALSFTLHLRWNKALCEAFQHRLRLSVAM